MQPTEIQEVIAGQVDHAKPPAYRPGVEVGMGIVGEDSITVFVPPLHTVAVITYKPGPDLYEVTISDATLKVREYEGIYCDQLGELIFGADAERWTMPFGAITSWDDDGNETTVTF
jgi:hypothetical protein